MKRNQSGFTLIEIAIVLVIIGLLLGGVLKGQELINSAKVKNLAADFKNVPLFIYGYQDKYRALPGDDLNSLTHVSSVAATTPAGSVGNGLINGTWDSLTVTDESVVFWQQVRLAGLAAGPTVIPGTLTSHADPYLPQNSVGGRIGVESGSTTPPIANLKGAYIVCSQHILGKFAKQLDTTLDDGVGNTGSVMSALESTYAVGAAGVAQPDDATLYTVCMGV
ncbi:MAG: prepilin-type N-terminal cleavage/methylation domain-containing protein [Sideroxydans sp.]